MAGAVACRCFFREQLVESAERQPATDHLKAALNHGAHAISANKGPVVHAYQELMTLARERGKKVLCESTVMDGVPIFSMFLLDCRQPSCADFPAC